MRRPAIGAAVAAWGLLAFAPFANASELQYRIPPGWIDLVDPAADDSRVPEALVREARSGRYIIYAIDPENLTPQGALANFNVIEVRGSGRVTKSLIQKTAAMASQQAGQMNFDMKILDTKVVKLGAVDVGETNSIMSANGNSVRLLQYLIPGKTMVATLTYAAPPDEFDRYRPTFEASAMATTGAYAHRGGINWGRAFRTGAITGAIGGIVGLLAGVARKNKAKTATPAQSAVAPGSGPMWDCPTCKRRVPSRIDTCRCGALRPA